MVRHVSFAIIRRPNAADQLVLLLSYRAAVESITVELPSGLVDKGESAETSAVRELREETGYVGRALRVSGKQWTGADPVAVRTLWSLSKAVTHAVECVWLYVAPSIGPLCADPWKSTESCRMVFVEVDGTLPENVNPTPDRENEELQQVRCRAQSMTTMYWVQRSCSPVTHTRFLRAC